MSEEEKKAIEYFKALDKLTFEPYLSILLKLIENQQKEIIQRDMLLDMYQNNYISKDKIREKIEELESLSKNTTMQPSIYNYEIDLLKELLEE